ncbi:MAG TPA: hypothetical protein VJ552_13860 [Sediminibacterium sp.]|nr:hypothetical protein [Sediminibacterium sp.]
MIYSADWQFLWSFSRYSPSMNADQRFSFDVCEVSILADGVCLVFRFR